MSEIKKEIKKREDGTYIIEDDNTLADIVRMLLKMSGPIEISYLVKEIASEEFEKNQKFDTIRQEIYNATKSSPWQNILGKRK